MQLFIVCSLQFVNTFGRIRGIRLCRRSLLVFGFARMPLLKAGVKSDLIGSPEADTRQVTLLGSPVPDASFGGTGIESDLIGSARKSLLEAPE